VQYNSSGSFAGSVNLTFDGTELTVGTGGTYDVGFDRQSAGVVKVTDASSGDGDLSIPKIKSTTGQRYVCITTTGILVSSASACSGT
jgi:hypothetical protein